MKRKFENWKLTIMILTGVAGYGQSSQEREPGSFIVSGTKKGEVSDNYAYLFYNNTQDSVKIFNNRFEFRGTVKDTAVAQVYIMSAANAPQFYIENSTIELEIIIDEAVKDGNTIKKMRIDAIEGSRSFELAQEYKTFYQSNSGKKDFSKLLHAELKTFLRNHRSHPFSGAILAELSLVNPILTKAELNELYALLDLTKQTPQDLTLFKKGIDRMGIYAVGKPFLEFELPDQNGKIIRFRDFKGKIVLIDFWASWCGPCRKKNPELLALKQQYTSGNFEIIGISRDKNKKQWGDAIVKDKLEWVNLLDDDQKIGDALGIEHIPYNFLVDENGIIIGINLSTVEVQQLLSVAK